MRSRGVLVAGLAATVLALAPGAAAKDFEPGDLRLCGAAHCVPIVDQGTLDELAGFYYGVRKPRSSLAPALHVPYFELRFRNAYVTGIVATSRLDRFLSYGVHLERFAGGTWYVVPRALSREVRQLTADLRPLRVTRAALEKSR